MSGWGKADNKTASGTVAITTGGAVTGSSTSFTTEAAVGDFLRVGSQEFIIKSITSNTVATVINANPQLAWTTINAGASYTLSEKPTSLASDPSILSTNVFGVDATEISAGGDNVVSVAVIDGGTLYVEAPTVSFSGGGGSSAAATATISGGAVTAITVTNTGSSYETVPTVVIPKARVTIPTAAVNTTTEAISYTGHGLSTGDTFIYYNGGGTSITGLTSGTTYYAIAVNANSFKVATSAVNATAGTAVNLTGTGNNAQYFDKSGSTTATARASLGEGAVGGAAHAGWNLRTVGTGGRAGRVHYETLVAMGSMSSDASDDTVLPDA